MDDYELAFPSLGKAEDALATLEGLLTDFQLALNPAKTRILELPQPLQEAWVSELATFPVRTGSPRGAVNDTIAYFSRAFEIAHRSPGHGALKYALQRSRDFLVDQRGWRTLEGLILSTVSVEPTTMPVALDLLQFHAQRTGAKLDRLAIADVIEAQILRHAALRNGSEVAWALWAAIVLGIDLTPDSARAVSVIEDDCVALLALAAQAEGRFPAGSLDVSCWEALAGTPDALGSPHWLLTYEGTVQGWLHSAAATLAGDAFFSALNASGVRFLNHHITPSLFTGPAAPLPGGLVPDIEGLIPETSL